MYQVLIVDDEKHAVRGIQAGVRWESLNIHHVHTAHNAKQAREVFQNASIDLLICDIEMPKESGLELLEWVRECYPRTETIFLTCHSEFSYAQRALQLNSLDYILKPVDYVELEQVIHKALGKIETDRELRNFEKTFQQYYRLWETHKPLVMEQFWRDLIQQKISSTPQMIQQYLSQHGISCPDSLRYLPIYIRVRQWNKPLTAREERIMEFALRNAAEEMINGNEEYSLVLPVKNNTLLVILPLSSTEKVMHAKVNSDNYIAYCKQYFYCDVSCCIGDPVLVHEMNNMYRQLQDFDDKNIVLTHRTVELKHFLNPRQFNLQPPALNEWLEWMQKGEKQQMLDEINRYLDSWERTSGVIDIQSLFKFYQDFIQVILHVLQMNGLQVNTVFSKGLLMDQAEKAVISMEAFRDWICHIVEVAMNHIHSVREKLTLVSKVERYVSTHLENQELSREEIAHHVFLNPSYLSRVFKKEKGMTISDYLQQQRLELAKKLLEDTDLPISEIALKVGYSNMSYFSTLFKKSFQMNPSDYRIRKMKMK